uniref:DNA-(apurinic or apyrimidinic site) lyase n=1 Tax=uncultured marine thaumarchaeote KM3_06_C02 TaxID=1455976 RepID=A0A075G3Q4_9ARCH|nr:8-oxoguanine DNA glycosylase (OGG1) [uncultured marine thaumarchaeote KM3_06_C02]
MEFELPVGVIFNLDHTLNCGQLFRWYKKKGWWYGVVEGSVIKVKQVDRKLTFKSSTNIDQSFLKNYFRLDDNLCDILSTINLDPFMNEAINYSTGLRLVRQPVWECLISYICSSFSNIRTIKKRIAKISMEFGERIIFEGDEYYSFPGPDDLANADIKKLMNCSLGFRIGSVRSASQKIVSDKTFLDSLMKMTYEKAWDTLAIGNESGKPLRGVGSKVADCFLLFSLDKLEAFPTDVWVKRVVSSKYSRLFHGDFSRKLSTNSGSNTLSTIDYKIISKTMRNYFGEYAGYAQEYLYFYARDGGLI